MTKDIIEVNIEGNSLKTRNYKKENALPVDIVNDDKTNQLQVLISKLTVNEKKFEDISFIDIEKTLKNINLEPQNNEKCCEASDEESNASDNYTTDNAPEFIKKNNLLKFADEGKLSTDNNEIQSTLVTNEKDVENNPTVNEDENNASAFDKENNPSAFDNESIPSTFYNASNLSTFDNKSNLSANDEESKISATDNESKISATDNESSLSAIDNESNLSASDNESNLSAADNESNISATDNESNLSATDNESNLSATDNESNNSITDDECASAVDNEIELSANNDNKVNYKSLIHNKTICFNPNKIIKEEDTVDSEEEKYLKRGIISRNKSEYRFSPFDLSVAVSGHTFNRNPGKCLHSPSSQDVTSSNVFDVIDFNERPNHEYTSNFQTWADQQKSFECTGKYQGYPNAFSVSANYFNNNETNLENYQNINYQEVQKDEWSKMSPTFSLDNSCDSPIYPQYLPPTPPKSVSPMLKEHSEEKLFSSMDDYNVKKHEYLINIITNEINGGNKTEPSGIPEAEYEKLRSVLECSDDSTRNEMDVYLDKDESLLQNDIMSSFNLHTTTNILEDVADDNIYYYGDPLTPPNSEPPPQDGYGECNSPSLDLVQDEVGHLCSEKNLTDIINGIDEIRPDEMDIYLDNQKQNTYDTSYAKNWLQNKCKPNARDHAFRRLSQTSSKVICKKDKDGDTGLMIVYSQLESSPEFYENIFCMQEIVCEIKLCCDVPLGKAKRCKTCGNTDPSKFFTPLSLKNNQGYSALCCAVKTNLSSFIIDYLLDGILQNEEDVRRVFDSTGKSIFSEFCHKYPSLQKYI